MSASHHADITSRHLDNEWCHSVVILIGIVINLKELYIRVEVFLFNWQKMRRQNLLYFLLMLFCSTTVVAQIKPPTLPQIQQTQPINQPSPPNWQNTPTISGDKDKIKSTEQAFRESLKNYGAYLDKNNYGSGNSIMNVGDYEGETDYFDSFTKQQ